LENKYVDFDWIVEYLKDYSPYFFDETKYWQPERDFALCLDLDRFSFVLKGEEGDFGLYRLKKEEA
jgi:2-phosphosulfolactate phosphatase